MKIVLTAFIIILSIASFGQSLDSIPLDADGKVKYEVVIEAPGTAAELTTKIKLWAAEAFKGGLKPFITVEDKEQGLLSGNGSFNYAYQLYQIKKKAVVPRTGKLSQGVGSATFTLTFYAKDNKVKVIFTNIVFGEHYFDDELDNNVFNKEFLSKLKQLLNGELKDQEKGAQYAARIPAVSENVVRIFNYIQSYLNKKADNDF